MATERRNMLKLLARSANLNHRRAAASAGAAVAHVVAAGNALALARDLCEEGGWTRWLRANFKGSVRTAQRYMRVARHLPASQLEATRVSPPSQRAVLHAIRGAVFVSAAGEKSAAAGALPAPGVVVDEAEARRRLIWIAARRLRKLAGSLSALGGGACLADVAARISALATDLLLDTGISASTSGEVYFIEAVGADRVKIGVSGDVGKRFDQLAASFPGPLKLLGRIAGGRAREASLHRRLANFHIGGEWFHLTPGVRAIIQTVIADDPE
ncbi:MAG TPA: GIY-YIG nuclease family protein, partial [Pirellulales bacterium]|nr:GIY-YIG nuclease family protein [Pirellulales bacterium]